MICELAKLSDINASQWYEFSLQLDSGLVSIMLIHKDDKYTAFINSCPHQSRRMDYAAGQFLISETGSIICPAHGAEFDSDDGLCINGPCRGQSLTPVQIKSNEESLFAIIK